MATEPSTERTIQAPSAGRGFTPGVRDARTGNVLERTTPGQRGGVFAPDAGERAIPDGGFRAERTFPYTENIVDAVIMIGICRPIVAV